MITIELYKPKSVDISIGFPDHWNECTLPELEAIAECIFLAKYTRQQLLMQLLRLRLKETYPNYRMGHIEYLLAMVSVDDLALNYTQLTQFIFDKIELTRQPLPTLGKLLGPAETFTDMCWGEYEDAEALFLPLIEMLDVCKKSKNLPNFVLLNHKAIAEWVSLLWRAAGANGKRIPYHEFDKPLQPTVMANNNHLLVCMLWYMGCKAKLPTMFPMVYSTAEGDIGAPDPMATTKLTHHGAGPKNGSRADIRKMLMFEFLYDLQLEAEKTAIGQ